MLTSLMLDGKREEVQDVLRFFQRDRLLRNALSCKDGINQGQEGLVLLEPLALSIITKLSEILKDVLPNSVDHNFVSHCLTRDKSRQIHPV